MMGILIRESSRFGARCLVTLSTENTLEEWPPEWSSLKPPSLEKFRSNSTSLQTLLGVLPSEYLSVLRRCTVYHFDRILLGRCTIRHPPVFKTHRDVRLWYPHHNQAHAQALSFQPSRAQTPDMFDGRLVSWMQKTLILNLDEAVREAALWELDKPREEWLFGYPAELALLAGQVGP